MVILLYYYDYYYYSLFKKHTFISKKKDKTQTLQQMSKLFTHTHKHSTINVELLLAALRAKTRTIVNLKLLQRVGCVALFSPGNSLTLPSGRTQKISANVKGAFLLPSRMGTGGGKLPLKQTPR